MSECWHGCDDPNCPYIHDDAPAPQLTEMVERAKAAYLNAASEFYSQHGAAVDPQDRHDLAIRAVIAAIAPHFRNEQREADMEIANRFCGEFLGWDAERFAVADGIRDAIRASKEPTELSIQMEADELADHRDSFGDR